MSKDYGLIREINLVGGNLKGGTSRERRARKPIDKNIRSIVWQKYFKSKMIGKCYACRRPVTYDNFEVGHNIAVAKGGSDNINNLRIICKSCNRSMGTTSIEIYKRRFFSTGKKIKQKKRMKKRNYHYEYNMLTGKREKVRNRNSIW